jgi:hypothetical protein
MLDWGWAVVRVYSLVFTVVWPCLPIICLRGPLSYVLVPQSLSSVAGKETFASVTYFSFSSTHTTILTFVVNWDICFGEVWYDASLTGPSHPEATQSFV